MESLKKLEKRYPYGSYCLFNKKGEHVVVIPSPKGYEEKARKRYGMPKGGPIRVQLRTGREEVV